MGIIVHKEQVLPSREQRELHAGCRYDTLAHSTDISTIRYVKVAGSPLNPQHWPGMIRFLFSGKPQCTVALRAQDQEQEDAGGSANTSVVLDGFDDITAALQGSGISRQLATVLQAFVFYPLILPLVNMGATGSRGEFSEARRDYQNSLHKLAQYRQALLDCVRSLHHDPNTINDGITDRQLLSSAGSILKTPNDEAKAKCVLSLGNYATALESHRLLTVKYSGKPAVVIAAHSMMAGVLVYQAGALANFSIGTTLADIEGASVLSTLVAGGTYHGTVAVLNLVGHFAMGLGQIAMIIYGLVEASAGLMQHAILTKKIQAMSTTQLIRKEVSMDLLAQYKTQRKLNFIGKVLANGVLSASQVLMVMGGAIFGFGLPLLIAGAVLTLLAILTRIVMQKIDDHYFAYQAVDVQADKLPEATSLTDWADTLQAQRQETMQQMVWLDALTELEKIKTRHADKSLDQQYKLLRVALTKKYTQSHQQGFNPVTDNLFNTENQHCFLHTCLSNKTPGLSSFLVLKLHEQKNEPASMKPLGDVIAECVSSYQEASSQQRIRVLWELTDQAGLAAAALQHLLQHIVLKQPELSQNKHIATYLQKSVCVEKRRWLWNKKKTAYAFKMEQFIQDSAADNPNPALTQLKAAFYQAIDMAIVKEHRQHLRAKLFTVNDSLLKLATAGQIQEQIQQENNAEMRSS